MIFKSLPISNLDQHVSVMQVFENVAISLLTIAVPLIQIFIILQILKYLTLWAVGAPIKLPQLPTSCVGNFTSCGGGTKLKALDDSKVIDRQIISNNRLKNSKVELFNEFVNFKGLAKSIGDRRVIKTADTLFEKICQLDLILPKISNSQDRDLLYLIETDYFRTILNNYFEVPGEMRRIKRDNRSEAPQEMTEKQLNILTLEVSKIQGRIMEEESQKILTNLKFTEDKFNTRNSGLDLSKNE